MEHNAFNKEHNVTEGEQRLDPNIQQRRASDPVKSVWVGASAGTGKTKVLVDRVLRLLLPQPGGQQATEPHRILCLTFTKAAASEMALRINKKLGEWAVMAEDDYTDPQGRIVKGLRSVLADLTGHPPQDEDVKAARRLFAQVVDVPGGLKIMTIHSFCQSVLGRFPLEAGLSPHFQAVDEGPAAEMLSRATRDILSRAARENGTILHEALHHLATAQNEEQFRQTLAGLSSERLQLKRCLHQENMPADQKSLFATLYERLCRIQGLDKPYPPGQIDSLQRAACVDSNLPLQKLWHIARILQTVGGKRDQKAGLDIQLWLEKDEEARFLDFQTYRKVFLTDKGTVTKNIPCKAVKERDPACVDYILEEGQRLLELEERTNIMRCAMFTAYLVVLGGAILDEYEAIKQARAVLDYDDLIDRTSQLLSKKGNASWVMYKLDGGLDHILIDEAQDTNPEQWQIIEALTDDFFSGQGRQDDKTRTVFTVGDEKQSIYSFQRAAPAEFDRMKRYFQTKVEQARLLWHTEALNISFRSAPSVLRLVDEVFSPPDMRKGLGEVPLEHISYRRGEESLVELWPLFSPPEKEDDRPWTPPVESRESASAQAEMADFIADKISGWFVRCEKLASKDRPIKPGDIMILVRSRTALVPKIVRALKKKNIPVSGADRMVLCDQLAVKDIIAAMQFALLPEDDLTLAALLKSPLLGWPEDKIYNVAYGRNKSSLWHMLKQTGDSDAIKWLENLIVQVRKEAPYEFISNLLQTPCPADPVSGLRAIRSRLGDDVLDPLDELQNAALTYEREHIPTLQGFLFWLESNDVVIKRELEESGDRVRIMTVHGAKGLQAPIVIMPDTTRVSAGKKLPNLLWPDKSGLPLPLWSPKAEYNANSYITAKNHVEMRLDEEYRRLLYVAMTRAEDRLYIGGYKTQKTPIAESWYNYVAAAFDRLDGVKDIEEESGFLIRRLLSPQTRPFNDGGTPATENNHLPPENAAPLSLPSWIYGAPPEEPVPPRPLMPSRPAGPAPSLSSPLDKQDDYRFRRGNITHKLLQILPELSPELRREAAETYTGRKIHDLPATVKAAIVTEVMDILEHKDYAGLFGAGSMAEVPVTGIDAGGTLVSGQIDRLLVLEDEVWIVDYKTDRPPPHDEKDIPAQYRNQLKSYSNIVAKIYGKQTIRCFLLWTDGARLMEVIL